MTIRYLDRQTGQIEEEQVYGEQVLKLLYGTSLLSRLFGPALVYLSAKLPFLSQFYGWLQKRPQSKTKIVPFIEKFHVDTSEFLEPVASFGSFNDFFIRKLKPRHLANQAAICPADGRYQFFPRIDQAENFLVKGEKLDLTALLENEDLAQHYTQGSMMIARLCPTDYHRFHFPCSGTPTETRFINGWLYSVNPLALMRDLHIFTKNKRAITEIESPDFGKILYIEVGATNVGSIRQTFTPYQTYQKGDEKGFFEFGASALILLFEPNAITFDPDLTAQKNMEIKCLMGQSMGSNKVR